LSISSNASDPNHCTLTTETEQSGRMPRTLVLVEALERGHIASGPAITAAPILGQYRLCDEGFAAPSRSTPRGGSVETTDLKRWCRAMGSGLAAETPPPAPRAAL
jgi:hypothetical protein